MKTFVRGLIGQQDLNLGSGTFSRTTSSGGTQTMKQLALATSAGVVYADNYASIALAIAALPSNGGIVFISPGTYASPNSVPSGVALIGMGAGLAEPSNLNRVILTCTQDFVLNNVFGARIENIFFDFSTAASAAGLLITATGTGSNTFCTQNVFRGCTFNQAGGTSKAAVTLQGLTGLGGSLIGVTECLFDKCIIYGNSQSTGTNQGPALYGLLLSGAGTANAGPSVTLNSFHSCWIRGGLKYAVDAEINTDTNYFYDLQVLQEWATTPANSAVIAWNLNNPSTEVDADGLFFSGVNYTGNFTNFVRAGQGSGHVIDFTSISPNANTVAVAGGTPQFCGRIIYLNGNQSANYTCIGTAYTAIAPATTIAKNGSGGGNYVTASTSYAVVDATNMQAAVNVPTGWKLLIRASGNVQTNTGSAAASVAIVDLFSASLLAENVTINVAGAPSTFALDSVITGDGNTHTIQLQFRTSNASDSASINNGSTTSSPKMIFMLLPSF